MSDACAPLSMGDARALLGQLRDLGLVLWAEGDRLRFRGPAGALTPALRVRTQALKPELLELVPRTPEPLAPDLPRTPELLAADPPPGGAIPRVPDADSHAPSDAQRRLWVLSQLGDAGSAYHIAVHLLLDGPLDCDALARALEHLVDRHEVLRTRFVAADGMLRQRIAAPGEFRVRRMDLGTGAQAEARARALAREEQRAPFDLETGLPVRAVCAALGAGRHALLLTMHHIAVDGWSLGVLLRELSLLYRDFVAGEPDPLPPLRLQYRDFAQWQNRMLDGPAAARMRAYWLNRLGGRVERLELPTRSRPPRQTFRGAMTVVTIDPGRAAALRALVRRHRASLFMGLCALVKCLLHRYTGQRSITVGTPIAGRDHPDLVGQVGHYLNILVLLDAVDGQRSFAALLAGVKRTLLEALEQSGYPFNRLVDEQSQERDPTRNPIFDVMVSLQNAGRLDLALPDITLAEFFEEPGTSKLDLTFDFEESADGLVLGIRYNTDLFDGDRIDAMGRHFRCLLDGVLADEDRPVAALALMPPDEYRLVVRDFNRTAAAYGQDATLIGLFDRQARATPDRIAVVHGDEQLTYGDLMARSERIAGVLACASQGREPPVGVLVDRSAWLPAAVLGVLRAGAAYLPLDVGHPPARLAAITRAAGCRIVLTHGAPALPALEGVAMIPADGTGFGATLPLPLWEGGWGEGSVGVSPRPTPPPNPLPQGEGELLLRPRAGDPANVIFTSGTTGEPKGVVVTHGNVVAFLAAMAAVPGRAPTETLLSVTTPSFDIFGLELFLPLTTGGRLVVAGRDDVTDGGRLAALIRHHRPTMLQATPATWLLLCEAGWPGDPKLTMLCGGEALPPTLAARLLARGGALWNMYGPTETTIWSCAVRLTDADPPVPIGRPIGNTRVYVLDPNLRPMPVGVRGEIAIAGAGVARGYLSAPALTAQRFVPDPFGAEDTQGEGQRDAQGERQGEGPRNTQGEGQRDTQREGQGGSKGNGEGGRLYRTGDFGRWLADGSLEYLGRGDGQLKIRGHRIEAAEVEHRLRLLQGVRDAAVAARSGPDGQAELCAYLVTAPEVDPDALRAKLRETLPPAMVPSHFVTLDRLPLNASGKVDRRALPAPTRARHAAPPRDEAERILATLWAEILGVSEVGPDEDFFDLGGHSLTAMVLAGRVSRSMRVDCALADVFAAPTVATLAARLRARAPARFVPINRVPDAARYPASHAQRRLWVVSQARRASVAYNMMQSVLIEQLPGADMLDAAALETAFRRLIARHESLRTTFQAEDDALWQIVQPLDSAADFALDRIDLTDEPAPEEAAQRRVAWDAATPFDLAAGPLIRAGLLRLAPGRHVLTINMHHIVADAWSLRVMARELGRNYGTSRGDRVDEERPGALPLEPHQGALPLGTPPRAEPLEPFTWRGLTGGGLSRRLRQTGRSDGSAVTGPLPSDLSKRMVSRGPASGGGPGGKAPWRVSGQSPDLSSSTRSPRDVPALQYRDIAAWQAELDRQGVFAAQRTYWLAKLSGVAPARLPTDRPRPPEQSFDGSAVTLTLPADTVAALHRFARSHRTGLFSVLVAAVNALIYRYTAGEDVVVGCVVAGRTVPELEDQVGFHVNTLPLRNRVSADVSLDSLLAQVARTTADAFSHQEYPFDRLLAELPGRGPEPLFDVVVDYHENDDQENDGEDAADGFGGLRLSPFAGRPPVAKFDLLFLCVRDRGALRVTLEYATDLFGPARVAGMAGHFRQIVDAMLTAPERPIIELPLSGPAAPTPATPAPDDALEQFDFAEDDS